MSKAIKQWAKENKLPFWLATHICVVRDALGLNEWHLGIELVDAVDTARPDVVGRSHVNPRYLEAAILLKRDRTREQLRYTVVHELLHVVLAALQRVQELSVEQVPEPMRAHFEQMHDDAQEQTIERLTRAMRRMKVL